MLSAEALRLAAVEVLCPTSAVLAGTGFPTLAGHRVFDSRAAAIAEINARDERGYTPVLSLYTLDNRIVRRADAADEADNQCETVLAIVAELAVVARDGEDEFVDAMAGSDPQARMVLAALVSQVRFLLEFSRAGFLFRDCAIGVRRIEEELFAVPNLGLRWQRITTRMTVAVPEDRFEIAAGGLPEPARTLLGRLPDGSYAKAKLAELGSWFAADPRPPLAEITVLGAPPPDGEPIATTGDLQ